MNFKHDLRQVAKTIGRSLLLEITDKIFPPYTLINFHLMNR
jgi:hypothetical protein